MTTFTAELLIIWVSNAVLAIDTILCALRQTNGLALNGLYKDSMVLGLSSYCSMIPLSLL
jgi:hypothetical protein